MRSGRLASELPGEPAPGGRQDVTRACLILAMPDAWAAEGVERGYAIGLTGGTW